MKKDKPGAGKGKVDMQKMVNRVEEIEKKGCEKCRTR